MKTRTLLFLLPVLLLLNCDDHPAPDSVLQEVLLVGQQDLVGSLAEPFPEKFPLAQQLTDSGATYQTRFRVDEKRLRETSDPVLVRVVSGVNNLPLRAEAYPWKDVSIQNGFVTLPGTQFYPALTEHVEFLLVRPLNIINPLPIGGVPLPNPDHFLRDYVIIQRFTIRPEILRYLRCYLVTTPPCDQARCLNPYELAFDKLLFLARDGTTMKEVTATDCDVTLDPTKARRDTTVGGARILTYDVRAVIRRLRSAPGYGGTYGIVGNNSGGTLYSDVVGRTPSASGFTVPAAVGGTVDVNFTVAYTLTGGSRIGFREFFVTNSGTIERLPVASCFQMRRIAEDWIKVRINGEPGGCK